MSTLITSSMAAHVTRQIELSARSILCVQYLANTPASGAHITYKRMWQALDLAPSRGVECIAVFDNPVESNTAKAATTRAAARLADNGWSVHLRRIGPRLHAKAWVFDGKAVFVGSHNLAHQSMMGNSDLSLLTFEAEIADAITGHAEKIITNWEGPDYGKARQSRLV